MAKPKWLVSAEGDLGVAENTSKKIANPKIVAYFRDAGFPSVKDDETAWCAAFVNAHLKRAGQKGSGSLAARSFLQWGKPSQPVPGAIGVLPRGKSWQGHVGIVEKVSGGLVTLIEGNASNRVKRGVYDVKAFLGFRWPDTVAGSQVVKGGAVAAVGGTVVASAPIVDAVYKPEAAPVDPSVISDAAQTAAGSADFFTMGNVLGIVLGLVIVGAAVWVVWARIKAGKPTPTNV